MYRLPELLKAEPSATIYIPEGEKDVDNLRERGLVATTNPMGAGKWSPGMSEPLLGRHVVILPDNDPAGAAHARDIARELNGVAASIRTLALPGLPPKGDVSDWLATGGTAKELEVMATAVEPWKMSQPADDAAALRKAPLRANDCETQTDREFTVEGRGHSIRWLCAY